MTLEQIQASEKAVLFPADIAPVLGVNPHCIRLQAKEDPAALGFPVIQVGTRTLIPRLPFLQYMTKLYGV